MTDTTEKLRAVFLAAIMVLSVVAMTASFSGAVAAQNADIDQGVSDISIASGQSTIIDENVDGVLQSNNIGTITQTVEVDLTAENGVFDESNDFTVNIQDSLESGVSVSYVSGSDSGTGFASGVNSVSVTESNGDTLLNVNWAGSVSDSDNGTTETVQFDVQLSADVTASSWNTIDDDTDLSGGIVDHVASDEFGNTASASYRAVEAGTSAASQTSVTGDRQTSTIVDNFNPSAGDEYLRVFEGETLTVDANNDREVLKLREFTEGDAAVTRLNSATLPCGPVQRPVRPRTSIRLAWTRDCTSYSSVTTAATSSSWTSNRLASRLSSQRTKPTSTRMPR
ncbi:surface glycoprotein [Halovenus salina]|uniref:Surface glycoprotein n=1 Tax=Halovenus salina TaxID=1510225 RepID=A0ABD5W2B5_9EURY